MAKMNAYQRKLKEQRRMQRTKNKIVEDGALTAIDRLSIIPAYVLHTEFGFGYERLKRFVFAFHRTVAAVSSKKLKLSTLQYAIEHDCGLRYDTVEHEWLDLRVKEK